MKIIFSTYEAKEVGGSYLRSISLAKALVEHGHQVTLWVSAKKLSLWPKFSIEKGVLVVESIGLFPYRVRKGGYDLFDLVFRCSVIFFTKCDVVHSFNPRPVATLPGLIKSFFFREVKWFIDWADLWGKGGIADLRYGPMRFFTKNIDHYLERLMIRLPYAVTPISDDLVKKARKIRGQKNKIFFLGVGADIEEIRPINQNFARKKLNLSLKDKILAYLYVGTYDEKLLAQAFAELNKLRQDVKLLLLGPAVPKFEQELLLKNKLLQKKVLREGIVARELLSTYLAAADLMILPLANKEINLGKFPNKLGDYLASARPTIANPTGELLKILEKEQVGIFAPEEPRLFAAKINELLNQPERLKFLGKNARLLAKRLSWFNIAKQLESFYLK